MSLFDDVKANITAKEAAEGYGIKVNKKGMACCPFHDDKTPSMSIKENFHCFGCQESGDVIDFTAKLFEINTKEAAIKLVQDFNLPVSIEDKPVDKRAAEKARKEREAKKREKEEYERKKSETFQTLIYYAKNLKQWKEEYRPQNEEEELHPLFAESLQNEGRINSYIERFEKGDEKGIKEILSDKDTISSIRKRALQIYKSEVQSLNF